MCIHPFQSFHTSFHEKNCRAISEDKARVKRRAEHNAIEFDFGATVERRQVRRRT